MRVGVVLGGESIERDVSLLSAQQIEAALRACGHAVVEVELNKSLPSALQEASVDVVFPAVHGGIGENGTLQGCLELLKIPYVGSGVLASALAMDKSMAKRVFSGAGLPCARGLVVDRSLSIDAAEKAVRDELGAAPYMVKPNAEGSALGATRVFNQSALRAAIERALDLSTAALVEEFVTGREMTVGVLEYDDGPRALPVIEIVSKTSWYDYEARYTPGLSDHICPAQIPEATTRALQIGAVGAHLALGCRDYSRTDCLLRPSGAFVILEVNTLPGMTPTSLFPDAARVAGVDFPTVVDHLVRRACAR
jgi:D-alanine-D-alanine ligase